jgi:hypothetical protein
MIYVLFFIISKLNKKYYKCNHYKLQNYEKARQMKCEIESESYNVTVIPACAGMTAGTSPI